MAHWSLLPSPDGKGPALLCLGAGQGNGLSMGWMWRRPQCCLDVNWLGVLQPAEMECKERRREVEVVRGPPSLTSCSRGGL